MGETAQKPDVCLRLRLWKKEAHAANGGAGRVTGNASASCFSSQGRQYSAIQKYCRMLPASTNRCQTKCIYRPRDL